MMRNLLLAGLAASLVASLAACASPGGKAKVAADDPPARTPTEQYSIAVSHAPDEIQLAAHADGLSARQSTALEELVARWRETGGKAMTITSPDGGGQDVQRTAQAVEGRLQALGVASSLIHLASYDPAQRPGAPVVVGFQRYEAEGPRCGREWKSFTHTLSNEVNSNFGCAVTANIAAMIANPADLAEPRAMDDADAARRETVLGKYRQGLATSSVKDDQASGAISNVVH